MISYVTCYLYVRNASKNVIKILIGNKCDLEEKREITYDEGKELADMYGMKFIETSAKTSKNVDESFITMAKEIMAQNYEKEKALNKNGMR
jgi:GTPase SAR1 family protein